MKEPTSYLLIWPDLLAILLLLLGGALALFGRKGAYLVGVVGVCVGFAFQLLYYPLSYIIWESYGAELIHYPLTFASFLAAGSLVLALIGVALGLWERPAAPVGATLEPAFS